MFTLEAKERTIFGKDLKKERRVGRLPVVVYGHKEPTASLFVSTIDFKKLFKRAGESSIITLTTPKGKKSVLIHEIAYHPVNQEPVHADLYVVEESVVLKIKIPIEYTGLAPAVKELGGMLLKVLHELEIEALPKDLPHGLTVDVTSLVTLESQILVKDLVLPTGVTTTHKSDEVVAAISVVKEEIEETIPVDLSAIEVEKRGKETVVGDDGKTVEEPTKSDKKSDK